MGFPDGEEDERHEARPVFFFKVERQAREHAAGELERDPGELAAHQVEGIGFFFRFSEREKNERRKKRLKINTSEFLT